MATETVERSRGLGKERVRGLVILDPSDARRLYPAPFVPEVRRKVAEHAEFNRAHPYLRQGMGLATFHHGAGFTGSGEVMLDSEVHVEGHADGRVEVLSANIEKLKEKNACADCNLRDADLSNLALANVNLRNADLTNANFKSTILRNADFRNARLRNAEFRQATLDGADFKGADLSGASFRGADVSNVDFSVVDISGALFD